MYIHVPRVLQVRIENVKYPSDHIPAVLERVKADYLKKTYNVSSWIDVNDFLEQIARRMGRLLKVYGRLTRMYRVTGIFHGRMPTRK